MTPDPLSISPQTYLKRIKITGAGTNAGGLDFLARLQDHHLQTVPFENLDVLSGRPIVLQLEPLYAKIVTRRRGGFCYELNGLFAWLLAGLGYSVTRVSARVYDPERGTFGPEFDHMALLVTLDRTYLVDVGFGDSFRRPVPMPAGEVADVSGRYRLRPLEDTLSSTVLERQEQGAWQPQYRFTLQPRALVDYAEMCRYHQSSPLSSFTQRTVCTRATPQGRLTLTREALTVTSHQRKTRIPVEDETEFHRLLKTRFGIELDDGPAISD